LRFSKIPTQMKVSRVCPVPKSGRDKSLICSYRGVSVLMNIYRIFESILINQIYPYVIINKIIPKNQYGYTKGISSCNQHIDMQNLIYKSLNDINVKAIDLVFLDLSSAFDTVPHSLLLQKLNNCISGNALQLISNMFENRAQIVSYNKTNSEIVNVTSGVAQGGVLSPLFYNIYTADLPEHVKVHLFMFADDMVLLNIIYSDSDIDILNNDLNVVFNYCNDNGLKINPCKSEHLRITLKNANLSFYNINNVIIKGVNVHKHLGLIYDIKMSFNDHTELICKKSLSKFAMLKVVCEHADGHTFLKLYYTYILPIIEYSNFCFVPNKTQFIRIEKIQKKVTKFICNKLNIYNVKYKERLKILNIKSLYSRRLIQILSFLFKMYYKPHNFQNSLLNNVQFYKHHRHGILINVPKIRIELCNKYLFNYASTMFNNLPFYIRNETVYSKFVNSLNCIYKDKPCIEDWD